MIIEKISKKKSWFDSVPNLLCLCVWILDLQRSKFRKPVKVNLVFFWCFLLLFGALLQFCWFVGLFGPFIISELFCDRAQCSGSPTNNLVEEDINSVRVRARLLKSQKYNFSSKRFLWKRYRPTSPSWRAASLRTNLNVSLILFNKNYVSDQKLLSMHCNGLYACCFVCVSLFFCVFFIISTKRWITQATPNSFNFKCKQLNSPPNGGSRP